MFRNNSIKKAAHPRGMPLISYTYRTCIYKPPDYTSCHFISIFPKWAFSSCEFTKSPVTMNDLSPEEGTSNIGSTITVSTIERSPRAPSLYSIALSTTASRAESSNTSSTPSVSNNFLY